MLYHRRSFTTGCLGTIYKVPRIYLPLKKENNLESHPPPLALSDGFMSDVSHFAAKGCSAESFSETTSLAFGSPATALSIDSLVA